MAALLSCARPSSKTQFSYWVSLAICFDKHCNQFKPLFSKKPLVENNSKGQNNILLRNWKSYVIGDLLIFKIGGGGVGKSYLIDCVAKWADKILRECNGRKDPDMPTVLKLAYTGVNGNKW